MAFSPAEQREYRALVAEAWRVHCRGAGSEAKDRAAMDAWTRDELEIATGHRSTQDCGSGRDCDRALAHFEAITEAGIQYHLRWVNGDLKRIRFAMQRNHAAYLRRFRDDAALHAWLRGIAQQSLNLPEPPELHTLSHEQIGDVTRFACIAAVRGKAGDGETMRR